MGAGHRRTLPAAQEDAGPFGSDNGWSPTPGWCANMRPRCAPMSYAMSPRTSPECHRHKKRLSGWLVHGHHGDAANAARRPGRSTKQARCAHEPSSRRRLSPPRLPEPDRPRSIEGCLGSGRGLFMSRNRKRQGVGDARGGGGRRRRMARPCRACGRPGSRYVASVVAAGISGEHIGRYRGAVSARSPTPIPYNQDSRDRRDGILRGRTECHRDWSQPLAPTPGG